MGLNLDLNPSDPGARWVAAELERLVGDVGPPGLVQVAESDDIYARCELLFRLFGPGVWRGTFATGIAGRHVRVVTITDEASEPDLVELDARYGTERLVMAPSHMDEVGAELYRTLRGEWGREMGPQAAAEAVRVALSGVEAL